MSIYPSIEYGPGTPAASILSAFTRATDAQGNGVEGGPLAGFRFRRANGEQAHSWADGVEVSMAGCGCTGAHQPECGEPDSRGGWFVAPAAEEGEEPPPGEIVKPDIRRIKHRNCPPQMRIFRSFPIFYPEDCDTLTEGPGSDRLKRLAMAGLETYTAYMLAHELATGWFTGNPSLQSEAHDITSPDGPTSPCLAAASLLDGWFDIGMPGAPLITGRMSATALAVAKFGNPIPPADVDVWAAVPGASAGHATFPPFADNTGAAVHDGTAATSTMFLHGRGFYALSPATPRVIDENIAAQNPAYAHIFALFNKEIVVAERHALLVWNTCTALAQDVDATTGGC